MLNKISSFLELNYFYPRFIKWKKFTKTKNNIIIFYIKNSMSKNGKEYLKNFEKNFSSLKNNKKVLHFLNSKSACQWFLENKFKNKKVVIIGIKHDCAYLYRLLKSNNNKVRLLKN